jgi:hypothetical protein
MTDSASKMEGSHQKNLGFDWATKSQNNVARMLENLITALIHSQTGPIRVCYSFTPLLNANVRVFVYPRIYLQLRWEQRPQKFQLIGMPICDV